MFITSQTIKTMIFLLKLSYNFRKKIFFSKINNFKFIAILIQKFEKRGTKLKLIIR